MSVCVRGQLHRKRRRDLHSSVRTTAIRGCAVGVGAPHACPRLPLACHALREIHHATLPPWARRPLPPRRAARASDARADLSSTDVVVERRLATVWLGSVTTSVTDPVVALSAALAGGRRDADETADDDDAADVRLYRGRVVAGRHAGTRAILKAYGASVADLAGNEQAAHAATARAGAVVQLSPPLGGFATTTGEQWLAFRDHGARSLPTYCRLAQSVGPRAIVSTTRRVTKPADVRRARRVFVTKTLRDAVKGLAALHSVDRTHAAFSPGSLLLSPTDEATPAALTARVADLALSPDISASALYGGATLGELWDAGDGPPDGAGRVLLDAATPPPPRSVLADTHAALWRRAAAAGARSPRDRAQFARSDDVSCWGLVAAFAALAAFAAPTAPPPDAAALARLIEGTFASDVAAFREYACEEPDWAEGVAFLSAGNGAGWDALARALGPWAARPDAAELLTHPFLSGDALEAG